MSEQLNFEADAAPAASEDSLTRLSVLCNLLLIAQFEGARLDAQLAEKERTIRQLAEEDIPGLLKECGLSEVRLADGTKVTVTPELECSITDERRAEALGWLREHNLGGIIKTFVEVRFGRGDEAEASILCDKLVEMGLQPEKTEDVHWQTLKSTLKAERSAGRDVPAETFALRPFEKARLTLPDGAARPAPIRKRK